MSLADFESVLNKAQHGAESLLAIHNLTRRATSLGVYVLTHVYLRDWLASDNRVDEVRARFVTPDIPALKFGCEYEFTSLVPFLKVTNAVISRIKALLHLSS